MAISEIKQGTAVYLVYGYGIGGKNVRIYCGKKGLESTEKRIKAAKKRHYEAKLAKMKETLLEE